MLLTPSRNNRDVPKGELRRKVFSKLSPLNKRTFYE
jgi:hypothetical protein